MKTDGELTDKEYEVFTKELNEKMGVNDGFLNEYNGKKYWTKARATSFLKGVYTIKDPKIRQ
jgi:hypothetical protein